MLVGALATVVVALLGFWFIAPGMADKRYNTVGYPPPYAASTAAQALHGRLRVADLHADILLWNRDLLTRYSYGHIDLPRLIDGHVAVQAFTVVTKTPRGMNIESNAGDTDNITLLAMAQRWPVRTWTSLTERALYQARRLHEAAGRSDGRLVVITTTDDLTRALARRETDTSMVIGFLGLEGAHALAGDVNNLDRLYEAGFRMIGLAHFFDNEMAGSAHGVEKGGLTESGRQLIARIEQKQMFVDLAHASARTIDDVLAIARRPVVVSHTGVKGTCNNARNLTDDQLKGVARTGGVVAIGFWPSATCGPDAASIARSIRYAADLIGVDAVALGSDFDGAVETPFDATGLVQITDALLLAGFDEAQIRKIMGENIIRLLQSVLPPGR